MTDNYNDTSLLHYGIYITGPSNYFVLNTGTELRTYHTNRQIEGHNRLFYSKGCCEQETHLHGKVKYNRPPFCSLLSSSIDILHQMGYTSCQFLPQVVAWFPDMFWNFYSLKNHKISNSMTTKAREKISIDLESLEAWNFSGVCLSTLKTIKFYLIKFTADF